jgi:hypothetical protein
MGEKASKMIHRFWPIKSDFHFWAAINVGELKLLTADKADGIFYPFMATSTAMISGAHRLSVTRAIV